jgi:integrase
MARPPSGQVVLRDTRQGRIYALRFHAYGRRRYLTLGSTDDGWTQRRAEEELANVLADVRRGIWKPPQLEPERQARLEDPTFHQYASEWLAQREQEGLRDKTIVAFRWSLVNHLLPFFAEHRLAEITPREVKRYTQAKLAERNSIEQARSDAHAKRERFSERSLSNASINHTLRHLAQILEAAVDDELIPSNPASGSRRRLKAPKPARPWVEPEQLIALLDAAEGAGRLLLAILAGAGLRIGEALALRWQNVDLGTRSLHVTDAKTAKGIREVHLTPALHRELVRARTARGQQPSDFVIATATGHKHNPSNLRRDVLAPAVSAANLELVKLGIAPIGHITFHSLRRTYASLRCACGDDIRYTADQLGHEDPRFTLKVYAQAAKRRERLNATHRRAYDAALTWARMTDATAPAPETRASRSRRNASR